MNKICHITSLHNRYSTRIFYKQCNSLSNNGYDVTLLVNDAMDDEIKNKIKIISTKFSPKNRKQLFIDSKKIILKKALEINADIYQLHDPDLLLIGKKLKKRGKKVIFDSHEDVPELILDKEWIPKILRRIISNLYRVYEKVILHTFDGVISVTPNIVDRLKRINENTIMITNYPIVDTYKNINRNPKRNICFAGGLSRQWCHEEIISAIEKIEDMKYILAGKCSKEYLDKLKSLPGWEKVEYKGFLSHEEVLDIYSMSLVGISLNFANQIKNEGTLGNNKLFEYMAAGLPVICTNYRIWKEIVEGNNCGICINPKDILAIKKAIQYILDNPKDAEKMGENGKKASINKYNWQTQEIKLLRFYSLL